MGTRRPLPNSATEYPHRQSVRMRAWRRSRVKHVDPREAERKRLSDVCRELGVHRARQKLKERGSKVYVTTLTLTIDGEDISVSAEAEGTLPSLDAAAALVSRLRVERGLPPTAAGRRGVLWPKRRP